MQGAEKLIISKMLEQNSNRRTFPIDRHAGMVRAGPGMRANPRTQGRASRPLRESRGDASAGVPAGRMRAPDSPSAGPPPGAAHAMLHARTGPNPPIPHRAQAVAGVAADGRAVVNRAQSEAQQYKSFYGHTIPGSVLAERVASYVHVFNLYWYVRPMGVTSLVAAYDDDGPALFAVDPAGTVHVST